MNIANTSQQHAQISNALLSSRLCGQALTVPQHAPVPPLATSQVLGGQFGSQHFVNPFAHNIYQPQTAPQSAWPPSQPSVYTALGNGTLYPPSQSNRLNTSAAIATIIACILSAAVLGVAAWQLYLQLSQSQESSSCGRGGSKRIKFDPPNTGQKVDRPHESPDSYTVKFFTRIVTALGLLAYVPSPCAYHALSIHHFKTRITWKTKPPFGVRLHSTKKRYGARRT